MSVVPLPPACANCEDQFWVCENHPDRPWDCDSPRSCNCGAGLPCPVCSVGDRPPPFPKGFEVDTKAPPLQPGQKRRTKHGR